jgi:hypothetical protein
MANKFLFLIEKLKTKTTELNNCRNFRTFDELRAYGKCWDEISEIYNELMKTK